MKPRFLIAITMLIGSTLSVCAQNVFFFSSKEGLSNTRIRSIKEDSRHNVWITTQNGLNRWDGVKMNTYRNVIGDSTSLRHNESTCVFELEAGKMLVGTGSGVSLYDYATDRFTDIPFIRENGDSVKSRTVNINRVKKNRIIISYSGYGNGELLKDGEGKYYIKQSNEFDTGDRINPVQLMEDKKQRLWVVNSLNQLYRQVQKGFRGYPEVPAVRKISLSSTGKLYAATINEGLYVYDEKADRFTQVAPGDVMGGVVTSLNPWTDGRMFICADGGGVHVYNERMGNVTQSAITMKDFDLTTSNVNDAISDSFGNVWVGIYLKGVMMKPVNQSAFEYIGQKSITKNTIGTSSVFSIARALGEGDKADGLWVAPDNDGLYWLSADGTSSQHWDLINQPGKPHAFTTIYQASPSTVLLGTFNDGLWQMKGGSFSLLTKEVNHIFDIQPANDADSYWISTMGQGFCHYHLPTGATTFYRPDYEKEGGTRIIGNAYVYALKEFEDVLLVGTSDGLYIAFPEADGTIEHESRKVLSGSSVRHFAMTPDNKTAWIATNSGLVKLNCQNWGMKTFTTENGLPTNSIMSLCLDGEKLWIGTDYGLSCMDVEKETFTNFYSDDGMQDNEFSRGAVLVQDGKLYFGGIGGITYFDSKLMEKWQAQTHKIRLRLVDVLMGDKTIHKGDMSGNYEILQGIIDDYPYIELNHDDNHFTIELNVDGLTNQHVYYEYSINGSKWVNQGGMSNRIVFDNLPSGVHHIKLRAYAFGAMSEERELVVVVHAPWYASIWAQLVYFLLFLLACWLGYQYVKRQVEARRVVARHRQQQELNEARIQFFMNISHEIRTPMTLILAPLEKLISTDKNEDRQHNYQLIKQNAKRILRLINQMMDIRKIEKGKFLLDYQKIELVSFLQNIFDVFVTNAQGRNIQYDFLHNQEEQTVYVDAESLDKIVMNLLSNSFKFTPDGGAVTLELRSREEDFDILVTDTGMGIPDTEKPKIFERFYSAKHQNGYIGTGIGLNLTSMLVKLHKGDISVADNPEGQGTQFMVTMPVGDASLKNLKPEPSVGEGGTAEDEEDELLEGMDSIEQDTAQLLTISCPNETHRRNALLVEDDDAIRQYVHSELSNDLVIHSCTNGQEAWDYIVEHPGKVDIVVSDIMMPVMDGMTLCQKIKSNFNTNHIPIVLMTALGSDSDRIAGITNGADAYVSKPFNIDVLRTTVVQLLKSRQLLQGKFHGDRQQEENIEKIEMESPDEHLMKRVMKVINENMDNPDLSVELIADKVGISRVHFYRKMKDLTGQAPRDFVKYVRLKEAARLLKEKRFDITGVSIATGFKSLSAFSTNFKSLYGVSPTEWIRNNND